MTSEQSKLVFELISNPPPGSKLAEAKAFGIDLTLLYENLKLSPEQRALRLVEGAALLEALRAAAEQRRNQ